MAYGIIRVRNLHQADLKTTEKHNFRQYAESESPANVIAGGYSSSTFMNGADSMEQAIQQRYDEAKVKQRSDSVVALEYVLTLSPEAMSQITRPLGEKGYDYSDNAILCDLSRFIFDKHGAANVIAVSQHMDESNPHVHIIVTPILSKEVKWKNAKGEGVRTENRLCAKDFTGDKDKLRLLQSDYFDFVKKNIQPRFPNIDFTRGVDARDRRARKEYYSKMTNHVLGSVRKELEDMKILLHENKLTLEEFDARKTAIESKISTISSNIEKKSDKDMGVYRKAEKWAKNGKELGL